MTAPATMRAALSVRSQKRRAWEHWTTMASPQRSDAPSPADPAPARRPVLRLRLVPWDVSCLVALLALLILVVLWTDWYSWLFGFLKDVCTGDTCPSVPFGVDFYIYPVVWGGIGAAIAAALVGPFVSLLKGWYLSFWPVLAIVIVLLSSAAGSVLTEFSSTYWHGERSVGDTSE
ncbi:MAG: hypothetical protein QOE48_4922 [Mycobacterium sp.]|jgi:hypothetical protein|nr:hypothetical protein [Mycobacterium sp.]